ncbi:unnamed protein product [Blepharisma stoltei]|uniref:Uncharacterized protein n=1 Tax=Blepharisma stoltei TaxID=1481888 RepID=A0AAU9JQU6_9CILI|nr:unnamed protein product [Blepharisma stoltei]
MERRIDLVTNFFELEQPLSATIKFYALDFIPPVDPSNRQLQRFLISSKRAEIESRIGRFIQLGQTLASAQNDPVLSPISFESKGYDDLFYIITISISRDVGEEGIIMQKMYANGILKRLLFDLGMRQVTKLPKFYHPKNTVELRRYKLEVWKGNTASFAHHMDKCLLNIDFASKIVNTDTVLQAINNFKKGNKRKEYIESELIGKIVMARYGNFRCYRIEGICWDENPTNTFNWKGQDITYVNYYERFNRTIRDIRQPLIKSTIERGQREIKLIPELCYITGIPDDMKNSRDIAEHTRLRPKDRFNNCMDLAQNLIEKSREMQEANLNIRERPIAVTGQRLDCGRILNSQDGSSHTPISENGSFAIRNSLRFANQIKSWIILQVSKDNEDPERARRRDNLVKQFIEGFKEERKRLGLNIANAPLKETCKESEIIEIIDELKDRVINEVKPQICIVILPEEFKGLYHAIKETSCMKSGIPIQVVMENTINDKKFKSALQKIMLQIAAKTRSCLWSISNINEFSSRTMVIGIDVFHDTVNKAQSILGFVASFNEEFTQYFNTVKKQDHIGQEIAGSVSVCFTEAINAYYENSRHYPEMIVIYRDGVSDSQIDALRIYEIEGIKNAIASKEGWVPGLAYIIINKKTNGKLYRRDNDGNIVNPLNGTFVDTVVVPDNKSFYLISHNVNQGVATPILYRVIEDSTNREDIIVYARLAYKLCFLYYNWTGAIKIPAPTMMAHKLAYIVGQSVHDDYLPDLKKVPWFY